MKHIHTFESFSSGSLESINEAAKEVVLSNEILDFLEERGVITGTAAQKVHKDLTAFLKGKGVNEGVSVNEGSFTSGMSKDSLEIYNKYLARISADATDSFKSHKDLNTELDKDPEVSKNPQKRLIKKALDWAMTMSIEGER
jgi:hypothetical protein